MSRPGVRIPAPAPLKPKWTLGFHLQNTPSELSEKLPLITFRSQRGAEEEVRNPICGFLLESWNHMAVRVECDRESC